ncbi:MAG: carnitine 3-dehydrogenase [Rhodobacter sp.]|nr:carnitine 3-dehydrogenase [Rhodobacter sp.]
MTPGTAAIIGGGVIGGGWAARFALMGWNVRVLDPDPDSQRKIGEVLANARRALPGLADAALPPEGRITFCTDAAVAVSGADWVQESVPERLELKRDVYRTLQEHAGDAIIASSTSGFKPSELQAGATDPGQILVAHPFNPVYLLPVVELVGTEANPPETLTRADAILKDIGMHPLHLEHEIDAHIADRLMEAVWREALWLVKDGVATTEEIDDVIRLGFGLRWAQMGLFETFRIAGGEAGMRHFLHQFGPALKWPWTKLMDVPDLTEELIETIAGQSDVQSGRHSIRELERHRDTNLVALMRALKSQDWGAGAVLNATDAVLRKKNGMVQRFEDIYDLTQPILTLDRTVPLDWTDYNGHMNEAKYLQAFGDATDRFMEIVGCDAEYIATGGSYFTAETHIRHLDEIHAGHRIHIKTLCVGGQGKKMHLFHELWEADRLCATGEHFLLHVSLDTRRPSEPSPAIARHLAAIEAGHQGLARPAGLGRAVGQPR